MTGIVKRVALAIGWRWQLARVRFCLAAARQKRTRASCHRHPIARATRFTIPVMCRHSCFARSDGTTRQNRKALQRLVDNLFQII